MEKAAFRLESFSFPKASIDFTRPADASLEVYFSPSGKYFPQEGLYELVFSTTISCENTNEVVANVDCVASFRFKNAVTIDDIPSFFYPNSLAILFPYIRAFISTISLQANVKPVVLPTLNLRGLEQRLKNNTIVQQD